ncbi:MAG TPA: 50S ribosomal protein L18 [Candidatus Nanoarchaeia archaeon]|nr:50S ribosomal protein L18 [Candidatus Nanoarchaeia archaeon]
MTSRKPKTVLYRRRRLGKTNYRKRIKFLTARKPRAVVRITNHQILAQLVEFGTQGDKVLAAADSSQLKKYGWNFSGKSLPAAYLTGLILAKKSLEKGFSETILDTGFKVLLKKGILSAFLKGLIDGGMQIPHGDKEIFPAEERISGQHISQYAQHLKQNKTAYEKIFSGYLKKNLNPETIQSEFIKVKEKILKNKKEDKI